MSGELPGWVHIGAHVTLCQDREQIGDNIVYDYGSLLFCTCLEAIPMDSFAFRLRKKTIC